MSARRVLGTLLLAGALLPAAVLAAGAGREPPPPLGTPRDFRLPEKTEFALDNGLGATLVPFGTVPKATVLVVLRTGNVDDGATNGLADFVAELLKEGAGDRDAAALAEYAAEMGGSLGIGAGGEQMSVSLDVLAERAPDAIALAADVLRRPRLPESEVARLQANFARQVEVARASPQTVAAEAFGRLLWGDHPYGRGLPTAADIAAYDAAGARDFVARNFGAARAHVYVGGRFDGAAVEAAIRRAFGDWAAGPAPTVNPPTGSRARQAQLIDRPDAPQSTLLLGLPVADPSAPEYLPLVVANTLLGGGLISRLDQNLREARGWTYGVGSSIAPSFRAASWRVSTDVNTPDTAPALGEIYAELERLRREPPPADELRRIQNFRAGTFVIGSSSRSGLLGQLAFLNLHGLPDEWLTNYVRNVYAVTPDDVAAVARGQLDPAQMTLVVVGDLAKVGDDVAALPPVNAATRVAAPAAPAPGTGSRAGGR